MLNLSVPGWGSYKAGRKLAGVFEMLTVFAGLILIGIWIWQWIARIVASELDDPIPPVPSAWYLRAGAICVCISWVWTVITSVSFLREAKAQEEKESQNTPPRLDDLTKPPRLP